MAASTKDYSKRLQSGKRWIIGSGAIAIVGIGVFWAYTRLGNPTAEGVAASLITVERGTVAETLSVSGRVKLGNQQTLKSPLESGVVEQVGVQVNDSVSVGQILITLRDATRETAVAEKQLEIQKRELDLLREQERVRAAQAKFNAARNTLDTDTLENEVNLEKARLKLQRDREKITEVQNEITRQQQELNELEDLLERGFIPADEVRGQEQEIERTRSQLRDAQLEAQQQQLEVQRLEDKIAIAPNQPRQNLIDLENQLNQAKIAVRTAERDLNLARLALQEAQAQLQESAIAATINGSVLDLNVQPGDVVTRETPLITLGNRAREEVIVQLTTLDAAKVQVGQPAIVSIIGPNAEKYPARVERVAQIAKSSEDNPGGGNRASVTAILTLNRPSGTLIPDSSVNAEITISEQTDVVFVNTELIQRDGDEAWVWVRNAAGVAEKRLVTLGLETITTVEVKSGLEVGDRVIQPSPDLELEPGLPITINN